MDPAVDAACHLLKDFCFAKNESTSSVTGSLGTSSTIASTFAVSVASNESKQEPQTNEARASTAVI